jgi:hypothetical protein
MIIKVPVYCDIGRLLVILPVGWSLTAPTVTRIQVALNVAIPACALCISRRLYYITNMKAVMITRADKRRTIIVDLLIGIGIPILQIIVREYC